MLACDSIALELESSAGAERCAATSLFPGPQQSREQSDRAHRVAPAFVASQSVPDLDEAGRLGRHVMHELLEFG
jgi:hypothetical protein